MGRPWTDRVEWHGYAMWPEDRRRYAALEGVGMQHQGGDEDYVMIAAAIDHGVTDGPEGYLRAHGINQGIAAYLHWIRAQGAQSVIAHAGILENFQPQIQDTGLTGILHMSASLTGTTRIPSLRKQMLYSLDTAKRLECRGISLHINVREGNGLWKRSPEFLQELAELSRMIDAAHAAGIFVLVMAYPRHLAWDFRQRRFVVVTETDTEANAKAVRLAAELGADVVKTSGPKFADQQQQYDALQEMVDGCFRPVVLAGGAPGSLEIFERDMKLAARAGVAGAVIGRSGFLTGDAHCRIAFEAFTSTFSDKPRPLLEEPSGVSFVHPITKDWVETRLELVRNATAQPPTSPPPPDEGVGFG